VGGLVRLSADGMDDDDDDDDEVGGGVVVMLVDDFVPLTTVYG